MLPEFVPNFLATLSYPPWTKELRWGLFLTIAGEERVPFHAYVRRRPTATGCVRNVSSFRRFVTLPTELQNHILSFCSGRTLFQVMQTSSALRIEASKLFWANPKAYFLVPADWLIDGAYPAYTHSDLSFLPYVQNLLVDYREGTDRKICPLYEGVMVVQSERIAAFWNNVTKRCPSAKRVVIDQNWLSPAWRMESQPVPRAVRILIHSAPLDIETSAFIVEETTDVPALYGASVISTPTCQRSLYRPSAGGVWTPAKSPQPWKTILPPAKQFNGPVGKFEQLDYESTLAQLQLDGLWPLMVEALDRYHFHMGKHNPFSCPSSTCDKFFQKAGEWTVHAAEAHYCNWVVGDRFSILPTELRVEFEKRKTALERKGDEIRQGLDNMQYSLKEESERKERRIERAWIEQLENDAAWDTGTTPKESRLWRKFVRAMEYEEPRP